MFHYVISKLGRKKNEILMVGDSLANDILPAKALGLKTVFVHSKESAESDASFKTIHDFLEDLKRSIHENEV